MTPPSIGLRDWLHRAIVLLLLVGFQASTLESAVALAGDGVVHHESSVEAAQHTDSNALSHSEDAADESSDHDHGPTHRHGTSADHCTHVHGLGVPASWVPLGTLMGTERLSHPLPSPGDHVSPPKADPPRI